ncbi:MAG: YihA family ribosome biogenesis GTP-binding protein [Ruminococcaceae bacterium]|nr:YihA family ribosome biogenesis GTP-binding protein [Oscillospiraceae bacterium]
MVIKNSEFVTSAVKSAGYPQSDLPEIAFAGRSNVGKSSFVNKFLNRKNIAKVSKTQGKTKLINFFKVNNEFMLVDLPGYGYANVSKGEQLSWGKMIEGYLNNRGNLKAVFLLCDIRHEPTEDDVMMFNFIIERGFTPFVIVTKADKLAKTKVEPRVDEFKDFFGIENVFAFSSLSGYGRDNLLKLVEEILED